MRSQLKHLLLDVDFLYKPTIVAFRRRFGYPAVLWLIETYCQMSRASNALVTRYTLEGIADDMRLDNADALIDYALAEGLILQEGDDFTNERVVKDQESLHKKRTTGKTRVDNHRNKSVTDPVTQPVTDTSCNALQVTSVTRYPDPVYVSGIDLDLKNNVTPLPVSPRSKPEPWEPPEDDADVDEFQRVAYQKLQNPHTDPEPAWTRANGHIGAGRCPMIDYPDVWLTPSKLAEILRDYDASEIPPAKLRLAFNRAQSQAENLRAKGKDPSIADAFAWLTGFIKHDLQQDAINNNRLIKSQGTNR